MEYAQHPTGRIAGLQPAQIGHLVPGAVFYMRDPRQTPVSVTDTDDTTASFTVRVDGFEDKGAVWCFALWHIEKFSVPPDAPALDDRDVEALTQRMSALRQQIEIPCDPVQSVQAERQIADKQEDIAHFLAELGLARPELSSGPFNRSKHDPASSACLKAVMQAQGLWETEQAFVQAYASNPHAGEMIKAHRLVLAELGLCPYAGKPLRDETLLEAPWGRATRRQHILTRFAFMRWICSQLEHENVLLYRTIYADKRLTPPRNTGFVSTTFRREVALALFEAGERTGNAAMYAQHVPVARVFMTYLETPALSARYEEAEAVLLFDPDQQVF